MPGWRAFLALCAAYLLMTLAVEAGIVFFDASDVPEALVFIGNVWRDLFAPYLAIPFIARAGVLAARSFGLRGWLLIVLNLAGLLALPAWFAGFTFLEHWNIRPPAAACLARPIPLTLAGVDGSAPWNGVISLYLGQDARQDARYLFSPAHRRWICRKTANGAERLAIRAITLSSRQRDVARCGAPDLAEWEKTFCNGAADRPEMGSVDRVILFDPNGIRLGDFGIPDAPTGDGDALRDDERLVAADDPAFGRATAVCRSGAPVQGWVDCQMRRSIAPDLDLFWGASAAQEDLAGAVLYADAFARSVCADLFGHPGCGIPSRASP